MNSEIISVGTELLLGQIDNINTRIISQKLSEIGINVFFHTSVGDNRERISSVFKIALERSDLIIFTGGLGPTLDDLTKETVAEVLRLELNYDEDTLNRIRAFFKKMQREMPENNKKQALVPEGAITIPNENGTAPGIILQTGEKIIILLPGPPNEMEPMLNKFVIPFLRKRLSNEVIKSRVLRFIGIGESSLEQKILDILKKQTNPTVAPLAKQGEVTLRITAKAKSEKDANELIEPIIQTIKERVGEYIYSYDNDPMEAVVGRMLIERRCTISIAESCTGGYLSHLLTNIPGISAVFDRGIISYSNKSKTEILNVPAEILKQKGAVSQETAISMASWIRKLSGTDLGVAITGIAGPDGGTPLKPVGLVFIALSTDSGDLCEKYLFNGNREAIKRRSALAALDLIRRYLKIR
ncbi:Putative competence-damage inducible protein [Koleobacter methoxysyntrophicus]|uniref:Putative competence-damage inducible protein n=1 Tax=Koleobacter methoxysyntrophicus TaxID=2751313 RepID=A0A8A0RRP1_9FIRM|nr:competence/damage-inducible protein A [Koleobacter methoxysyntrophicus]QSQ10179.1 Putative competence-damage inducible protein [Koleobacter methoxysyntrophicus]